MSDDISDDVPGDLPHDVPDDLPAVPLDFDDEPALLEELGRALGHEPTAVPPADRVAALRAAAAARRPEAAEVAPVSVLRPPSRRRAFITGGIAAGVAGVAGYLLSDVRQPEPVTTSAAPMEQISFSGDAEVAASSLINHTWGTELLLDVSGLQAGSAYTVVYDTAAGEVPAGSLLAVAGVVMKCRFNAAALRAAVRSIEVRTPSGDTVLRADLPDQPA